MEESENDSLIENLIKNNKKDNFISKGLIGLGEDGNVIFISKMKRNETETTNIENFGKIKKEEEFFSDSEEEDSINQSINSKIYSSKSSSICLYIDVILNQKFNKYIEVEKRDNIQNNVNKNNKRFSDNNQKLRQLFSNKKKNNSCIIKFNLLEINIFLNKLDKEHILKTTCSICFENFKIDEEISLINHCTHIFHTKCLNKWIGVMELNKDNCPYCKREICQ